MTQSTFKRENLPPPLQRAIDIAVDKKAVCPLVLYVREITGYTNWVLLLSATSNRHVEAITEAISIDLKQQGQKPLGTDGLEDHLWDLLDYGEFMIHVFYHPVRVHYDLESMWNDAPRIDLGLPPEVMDTSSLTHLRAPEPMPAFRGDHFGGFEDEF